MKSDIFVSGVCAFLGALGLAVGGNWRSAGAVGVGAAVLFGLRAITDAIKSK